MAYSNPWQSRAPTLQELQQQLLNANNATRNMGSYVGGSGGLDAWNNQANANVQRAGNLSNQISAMQGGGSHDPMADDLAAIRALTEGRANDLAHDPYNQSVMDFLQGVTNGSNVPYTNEVQNAMLAQQGKGFADAEASSMEALRQGLQASGGSIYDPSFQAASREAESRRQGQNLDAAGRMASQANLANFDARMNGANSLGAARNAQNAQVNQMNLAGANYRSRMFNDTQMGTPAPAPTNYNFTIPNQPAPVAQAMPLPPPPAPKAPATAAPAAHPAQPTPMPSAGWNPTAGGWIPSGNSATGGVPGNNAYQFFQPTPNYIRRPPPDDNEGYRPNPEDDPNYNGP